MNKEEQDEIVKGSVEWMLKITQLLIQMDGRIEEMHQALKVRKEEK